MSNETPGALKEMQPPMSEMEFILAMLRGEILPGRDPQSRCNRYGLSSADRD